MGDSDIVRDQQESVFLQSVSLFISQFQKIWNIVKAFELQRTVKILHSTFLILGVMILAHLRKAIEGIYTVEREAEETSRPVLSLFVSSPCLLWNMDSECEKYSMNYFIWIIRADKNNGWPGGSVIWMLMVADSREAKKYDLINFKVQTRATLKLSHICTFKDMFTKALLKKSVGQVLPHFD